MKHQILAGVGLFAVITFCGYMISQLGTQRSEGDGRAVAAVHITEQP